MNKYIVIDFKNFEILSLNKVKTDFKENESYTGSVKCENMSGLIKELESLIDALKR